MKQFLIALDQLANTVIRLPGDGRGWADETFSARLFRLHLEDRLSDRWYRAVDALFFWDANHCFESWRSEVERAQLPGFYRVGHG